MVDAYACKGTLAERQKLEKGEFLIRNVFERHKKYTDFQRTSTLIYTCSGRVLSLGMIQYTFTGEEHHVSPHMHPRSGKKFVPTAPSTKATVVEEAAGRKGPSRIFDETSMKVGGVLDCELAAELPRDSKQVKNARQRVTSREREDEFASLLELAKEDVSVRNLQWTPSLRVVFCIDEQIDDIVRDCCSADSTSILSIDTTFNIGYSPHMKCSWREAITLYKECVLQTRRDIQRAVLGKGPYSLSAPYVHLTVTDAQWTGMDRKEREKHLQKLVTSSGECLTEEINEIEPATERMSSFESSSLPEFTRGSWNNANKILELEGIVPFPNDPSKKIIISLSRRISHTVKISGKKFTCSECPRFTDRGLCAHTLAVASELGNLAEYTKSYRVPLDQLVQSTIPSGAGKKDHEKRKRKRTSKPPREVSTFGDGIEPGPSIEKGEDTRYDVVFIKDTKATICYGCKGNVRNTTAEPPPPAPYDIFLRHKEFRVYRRRGETKIRISKSLEAVYYHPMRSCAPSASDTNIKMDDKVAGQLSDSNRQLLWREFGVRF